MLRKGPGHKKSICLNDYPAGNNKRILISRMAAKNLPKRHLFTSHLSAGTAYFSD
jgi:hypothetical protein